MKKLTQMLALASVAALCLSTGMSQDNNAGPGGPGGGGQPGGQGGGQGGGRNRGGQGGGNFDPAAMQQRMNDRVKTQFGSTDEEWKAIEPLVTKVNEARMASMAGMFGGGRNRGGGQGGQGGQGGGQRFGPEPSAEATALTEAVDKDAAKDELKAKMAAFRKAKAAKEAELKTTQDNLKKVLTTKQEAIALQMGLVQ